MRIVEPKIEKEKKRKKTPQKVKAESKAEGCINDLAAPTIPNKRFNFLFQ